MSWETIEARKLTPAIGAEISGADLARPLSNRQLNELHDALMAHQVLFFRDQHMSVEQHKAFGMGSILYLHRTPPVGGDTAFANMYLAYETLSEPIRRLVEGLFAFHTSAHVYSRDAYGRSDKKLPEAVHPVVRTHPVTGRKCLFVNRGFTKRIEGLKKHESDALLDLLVRHCETPDFQCRFRWDRNSVAFWDNRCVMHRATFDYRPHVRHGHRVTIEGDRPY